jgi:PGF-pre-PGF domain-containing protein
VYGYTAGSASYTIGSFEQGMSGGNSESDSFNLSDTASYQSGGGILSYHYFGITGFLDSMTPILSSVCGNGLIESGESCDNYNDNGACPNSCSSSCTVNSCGGSDAGSNGGSKKSDSADITYVPTPQAAQDDSSKSYTVARSYDVLPSGSNNVEFDVLQVPVYELILDTKVASANARFALTKTSTSKISYNLSKVHSYIDIEHTNVDNSNIEGTKIRFRVGKSWLSTNSVSKDDIILLRHNELNNSWDELPTRSIGSDANYTFYESVSPGLSLFAITAKISLASTPITSNVPANPETNTSVKATSNTTPANSHSVDRKDVVPGISKLWMGVGIVVVILALVSIVAYKKKKAEDPSDIIDTYVKAHSRQEATPKSKTSPKQEIHSPIELKLEEWILNKETLGYNREQLRQFLLKKGYNPKDVDEAVKDARKK